MDLSTYEGRQAARDAGYWVGADNSGQVVAEPGHPGGQAGTGGGGSSGAAVAPSQPATGAGLGGAIQSLLGSIASGNLTTLNEQIRQFNTTFGLDQSKFAEAVRQYNTTFAEQQRQYNASLAEQQRQYNQGFGLQQAGITGTYNGTPTEAARQFNVTSGLNAAQLAGSLSADPFRQRQVEGQLGRLLQGQGVAGFQSPTGSAADTASVDYILNQIRNPLGTAGQTAASTLNAIPAPNRVDATEFFRSSPGTQDLVLSGIKAKYGLDPADALAQIKATLPQFQSPTLSGNVRI